MNVHRGESLNTKSEYQDLGNTNIEGNRQRIEKILMNEK